MLQKRPGEKVQVAWQTTAGTTETATVTLTASSPQ
jgi:hypothetical protein